MLFVFLLSMMPGFGQLFSYHVRIIRSNDLMNPSGIEQIIKDDKGYLWLLAASKIQRYDGKKFLSWTIDERCVSIQQDGEGDIWLASRQSVYRYKNDYTGFEKIEHRPYQKNAIRVILTGPDKKLYLLHAKGIARWNNKEKIFESTSIGPFEATGSFPVFKSAGNFIYFRISPGALARYNVKTGSLDSVNVKSPNYLYFINEDSVWVRQDIGSSVLVSFSAKSVKAIEGTQFKKKFSDNNFNVTGSFSPEGGHELLVFIDRKGYFLYNKATQQFKEVSLYNNGIPLMGQPPLHNFYKETNGTVWFANEEGVVHFNPKRNNTGLFRSSTLAGEESWNNDVRNITEDEKGNIWFATANGFCRWNKQNGNIRIWKPDFESDALLNYSSVRSLGYSNGKLIVGQSEKGFWIFDPQQEKFSRPRFENDSVRNKFLDDFNTNMVQLQSGDYLILSRNLWLLNKDLHTVSRIKLPGIPSAFKKVYEDNKGLTWLAGPEGIYGLDKNWNLKQAINFPELKLWCNAFVQLDDETFLAASKYVYEIKLKPSGQFTYRRILPELKDAHVSHFFKDRLGHIWIASDKGLYRYIPTTLVVEHFDADDNVQQFYAGLSNSFRGSDGTVYFGSMNGINYFEPEKIPLQNDPLKVYISNVTVNRDDSSFLLGRLQRKFNYKQNSLVFDFTAPYVYNAGKVKYRYWLFGADKNWIETGNTNTVRLTSLRPGKFTFRVAASLNGKDWFETAEPFSFTIKPPFWQTWWFRLLALLTLIAGVIFYFRRRIQLIKSKAALKQQMTELEVKALRAQMNPHFIFNAMNSIQQFTLKNEIDNANLYISKFSTLLRKVLHSSHQNFISLEEEIEQLKLYLEIEKQRLGEEFEYSVMADDEIETDALKIPGMMVQPFAENALKHGLSPKEGVKKLEIKFKLSVSNKLIVTITDNGIGRQKANQLKTQQEKFLPHISKGIQLVEERLHLLNHAVEGSAIQFEDLYDHSGNAAGTRVLLNIPLPPAH